MSNSKKAGLLIFTSMSVILAMLILPVLGQTRVIAKSFSLEQQRTWEMEDDRARQALVMLKNGKEGHVAEINAVIDALPPNSRFSTEFAKALQQRGETRAAFDLESAHAHFDELSLPNDDEMSFYADLADRVGRPEEAVWARARTGKQGHFRIWKMGKLQMLGHVHGMFKGEFYESRVQLVIDDGLRSYPEFRDELKELQKILLSSSATEILAILDKLKVASSPEAGRP